MTSSAAVSPSGAAAPAPDDVGTAARESGGRLRLVILTDDFGMGRVEQRILMTAPRLQREGFDVTVACLGGWGALGTMIEERGSRAIAFAAAGPLDLRAAGRLISFLRRERIQILHAHRPRSILWARLLGRNTGIPLVITSHHGAPGFRRLPGRLIDRVTGPMSDAVIAWSEAARQQALHECGLGPGRVHALPPAVVPAGGRPDPVRREETRRHLGATPDEPLIGAGSAPDAGPQGPAVLMTAGRILARDVHDVRFVFMGEGRGRLEKLAAVCGLDGQVVLTGAEGDRSTLMEALDLYVEPAPGAGAAEDMLEAMAAGLPVIAAGSGAAPEVILDGETGMLVTPGDADALAAACVALLRDGALRERLGRAARERAASVFRVDDQVKQATTLYRDLLWRRRPGGSAPRLRGAGPD